MLSPQRPQNLEFPITGAEQRGHGYEGNPSAGLTSLNCVPPQRPQNLIPSAKRLPQLAHATMPGIRLEC